MMAQLEIWIAALAVGGAIGALYCLFLWLGVRALTGGLGADRPQWHVFFLQAVMRMGVIFAALALAVVTERSAAEIGAATVGFIVARSLITARVRRQGQGDI